MNRTLVIGSNRGIGFEIARQLAARGDSVVATCRTRTVELDALPLEVVDGVDVTDPASLHRLAERLGADSLDALYVVAGVLERNTLTALDPDSIRRQFEINALGPLQAVASLRGCLRRGARVGLLTSRMGSIDDNTSGGAYGYRMSKAALNIAGKSLAIDLAPHDIYVRLLHPGFVRTEMTGGAGNVDADESAAGLIARVDELGPQTSGTFVHASGESLPW